MRCGPDIFRLDRPEIKDTSYFRLFYLISITNPGSQQTNSQTPINMNINQNQVTLSQNANFPAQNNIDPKSMIQPNYGLNYQLNNYNNQNIPQSNENLHTFNQTPSNNNQFANDQQNFNQPNNIQQVNLVQQNSFQNYNTNVAQNLINQSYSNVQSDASVWENRQAPQDPEIQKLGLLKVSETKSNQNVDNLIPQSPNQYSAPTISNENLVDLMACNESITCLRMHTQMRFLKLPKSIIPSNLDNIRCTFQSLPNSLTQFDEMKANFALVVNPMLEHETVILLILEIFSIYSTIT